MYLRENKELKFLERNDTFSMKYVVLRGGGKKKTLTKVLIMAKLTVQEWWNYEAHKAHLFVMRRIE